MTKTQTAHSPEQWTVSKDKRVRGYEFAIMAGADCVADVPETSSDATSAESNAHLLAAAPDMLAALDRVSAITSRRWRSLPPDSEEKQAHQQIVAAIRKARGE